MESKIGVRKTIPTNPYFLTDLIINLLRFVNFFAGLYLGISLFRKQYTLVLNLCV